MIRGHLFRGLAVRSSYESTLDDATIRAAHRNRRTALSRSASMLARLVQIGSSLTTVPLTLKYLGNECFGLWMTMSSVLAMAAFAEFGVGNGVMNTVVTTFGRDDTLGIRQAISSGMVVLSVIAASALTLVAPYFRRR
jgi:O-antigen/teichoic acid export membrane protein